MAWEIEVTDAFAAWYDGLRDEDADAVTTAVEVLAERGPTLKRPLVGAMEGSRLRNLKELRAGSLRVIFAFDARQAAILLLGADKAEEGWKAWYRRAVPEAERLYAVYLDELHEEGLLS